MKVYLAARYSRREELAIYAEAIRLLGNEVTSRWLRGNHLIHDESLNDRDETHEVLRQRYAQEDLADVRDAEIILSFSEPPRSSASRGGRHVELGLALGWGKHCIVVGEPGQERENLFHCLPEVDVYRITDIDAWLWPFLRAQGTSRATTEVWGRARAFILERALPLENLRRRNRLGPVVETTSERLDASASRPLD